MADIVTFDGENRLILVNSGYPTIDFDSQVYSAWKRWITLSDNSKYAEAIRVVGGDPISDVKSLGSTFFMMNGWRIRPYETDHRLTVNGNVFTDPAGDSVFIPATGSHSVTIEMVVSNLSDSTLAQMDEIEYASYNGGITIDVVAGTDSAVYPYGTPMYPCKTLTNATAIGTARGFTTLYVIGDITVNVAEIPFYFGGTIIGQGVRNTTITIVNTIVMNASAKNATVTGTCGNGSSVSFYNCELTDLYNLTFDAYDCVLSGTIELNNSSGTNFYNCTDGVPGSGTPIIEVNDCKSLGIWNYAGGIKLTNITTVGTTVSFNAPSGRLIVDATDTQGSIIARGVGSIIGTTGGTTITQTDLINRTEITNSIWNELIASHTTTGSFGYDVAKRKDVYNASQL